MKESETLKKTPLHSVHLKYGGKMVDFGGWELPLYFSGIISEHMAVRQKAGIFDVSHMGEISVEGEHAVHLIQELVTNDISSLETGQARYTLMCNDDGGIIDDLIVYRTAESRFLLVVNAANTEKDFMNVKEAAGKYPGTIVSDISPETAQIALQGPLSAEILKEASGYDVENIKYFWSVPDFPLCGEKVFLSRTGYTGEDGFEIYCASDAAPAIWEYLMKKGGKYGLVPVGLGARDTLRFEACLPLYGNELDEKTTPLEAGLERFVRFDKPSFRGKEALLREKNEGVQKKLTGIEVPDGIPRHGYRIFSGSIPAGWVTSGSYAPYLKKNLAMCYIFSSKAAEGEDLRVEIRGRMAEARVVPIPFYTRRR